MELVRVRSGRGARPLPSGSRFHPRRSRRPRVSILSRCEASATGTKPLN